MGMVQARDGIVVFDGVCSFCSASVRFILKFDQEGRLLFAPMQSRMGQELMTRHGLNPHDVQTFLLVKGSKAYIRSDAALEIAKVLRYWRWLRIFRFVPRRIRDGVYGIIARNRYRWFGREDACFLPTPEERARFLDVADSPTELDGG